MSRDSAVVETIRLGSIHDLPSLRPVLAADRALVDELVRSAKADVALLALESRVARREASAAEESCGAVDPYSDPASLAKALELVRVSLEDRLERRRAEFVFDAERERVASARLVSAAQAEATALVAAAREELLSVILHGIELVPGQPADVRVDAEPVASPEVRSPEPELDLPIRQSSALPTDGTYRSASAAATA